MIVGVNGGGKTTSLGKSKWTLVSVELAWLCVGDSRRNYIIMCKSGFCFFIHQESWLID